MERIEQIGMDPYSTIDYFGARQHREPLSYLDFISDLNSLLEQFADSSPEDFEEIALICTEFWDRVDIDKSEYVDQFTPRGLPDFWKETSSETRNVIATMLRLRIESDEYPWFGEGQVRGFVSENGLPEKVADKYMEFYRTMVDAKMKDQEYLDSHPINPFTDLEMTILHISQRISDAGHNYSRPKFADSKTFTGLFGISSTALREHAIYYSWGMSVAEILTIAEELAKDSQIYDASVVYGV